MEVACKTKLCSEQADLVLRKPPQGAQLVDSTKNGGQQKYM